MKKTLLLAAVAAMLVPSMGFAQTQWQEHHRWRAEDNQRLRNQDRRITQGVRDGQISQGQAAKLRANDSAIRAQENSDAALHGSHLTKQEQGQIRSEENANSRAIHQLRH